MRVLVQWALQTPQDWVELDVQDKGAGSRAWRNLPSRPEPTTGQLGGQDNIPGWVFDVNVQGVLFGGNDHIAVEPIENGVRVYAWSDDPDDGTIPTGSVWEFLPPAPDPGHGGQLNTRQTVVRYSDRPELQAIGFLPFSQFPTPPAEIIRHGVWLTDELSAAHIAARQRHGWREW